MVDEISRAHQQVGAGAQIHGGRNCGDTAQLPRGPGPIFAGELQHYVPTERESDDEDLWQVIEIDQLFDDRARVRGQATVIQRWSQMFGAAAIPHINAEHIESCGEGFVGRRQHIG